MIIPVISAIAATLGIWMIIIPALILALIMFRDQIFLIFQNIYLTITTVLTAVWMFVSQIFNTIYLIVLTIFNAIWGVISYILTQIFILFQFIFLSIKFVVEATLAIISAIIQTVLNAIWGVIGTTLTGWWNEFKTAFNNIKNTVTSVFQSVHDWFVDKLNSLWSKVTDITTKIWNAFKTMADGISSALRSIKFPHLSIGSGKVTVAGHEISYPTINVDWYKQGGWVENTGLAVVHRGEYVLSRDMLEGKKSPAVGVGNMINNYLYATVNTQVDLDYLAYKLAYMLRNV
jgi:hypothetical protein